MVDCVIYNQGSIYTLLCEPVFGEDITAAYSLYKISLDGSVREKVCELAAVGSSSDSIPRFIIHRGYVYYTVGKDGYTCIFKRNLKSEDMELIYKNNFSANEIGCIYGYGEGVLFSIQNSKDDIDNHRILYYSSLDNSLYEVVDNVNWSFAIADKYLIYSDYSSDSIIKMDLKTLKKQVFAEGEEVKLAELSYDGENIYADNVIKLRIEDNFSQRKMRVYDLEGVYLYSIDMKDQYNVPDFGDSEYLFQYFNDGKLYALNKSRAENGTFEWIMIGED